MRRQDLEAMDFEELWLLHEELTKILAEKITAEKRELEKRLAQLNQPDQLGGGESGRLRREQTSRPVANTRRWCRSTSIRSSQQRLGRDVVSSPAG